MDITLEFKGLDELMKGIEEAATESEIQQLNKKIIKDIQPIVIETMSNLMPRSADISKSGRGWGTQRPVLAHSADSIPEGTVRAFGDTGATANIGWNEGNLGDHFYVKFTNWGTVQQPPRNFVFEAGRQVDAELKKIAEKEYQRFLNNKIG